MRLLVRTKLMEMAASLADLFTGLSVVKTYSAYGPWELACANDSGISPSQGRRLTRSWR
jgi:hypothetical protein